MTKRTTLSLEPLGSLVLNVFRSPRPDDRRSADLEAQRNLIEPAPFIIASRFPWRMERVAFHAYNTHELHDVLLYRFCHGAAASWKAVRMLFVCIRDYSGMTKLRGMRH